MTWIVRRVLPDGQLHGMGEPFSLLEPAEAAAKARSARQMCPYVVEQVTRGGKGRKIKSLAVPTGVLVDSYIAPAVIAAWVKANAYVEAEKAHVELKVKEGKLDE